MATTKRIKGRATIAIGPDEPSPPLPAGLRVLARVHRPLHDDVLLVIEGHFLPEWHRGNVPYQFESLETLYEFQSEAQHRTWGTDPDWRPIAVE